MNKKITLTLDVKCKVGIDRHNSKRMVQIKMIFLVKYKGKKCNSSSVLGSILFNSWGDHDGLD